MDQVVGWSWLQTVDEAIARAKAEVMGSGRVYGAHIGSMLCVMAHCVWWRIRFSMHAHTNAGRSVAGRAACLLAACLPLLVCWQAFCPPVLTQWDS